MAQTRPLIVQILKEFTVILRKKLRPFVHLLLFLSLWLLRLPATVPPPLPASSFPLQPGQTLNPPLPLNLSITNLTPASFNLSTSNLLFTLHEFTPEIETSGYSINFILTDQTLTYQNTADIIITQTDSLSIYIIIPLDYYLNRPQPNLQEALRAINYLLIGSLTEFGVLIEVYTPAQAENIRHQYIYLVAADKHSFLFLDNIYLPRHLPQVSIPSFPQDG